MQYSKKTGEGRAERLSLLQLHEPGTAALLDDVISHSLRRDVQADDVLDACVAFVTAEARVGTLVSLAGAPLCDEVGLPMEMLYLRIWDEVA